MRNDVNREDLLKDIETKYPVEQIRVKGHDFWPFYRSLIYSELLKGSIAIQIYTKSDILRKFRNSFLGLRNLFRKYEYIFFSNEFERKVVEEKIMDKLTDRTIEKLGYQKSLYVEQVKERHLPYAKYRPKHVLSHDLILIFASVLSVFIRLSSTRLEGRDILMKILSDYDLDINHRLKYSLFMGKVYATKIFLRLYRPRMVFITDYGSFHITYAAHALGIPVTEYQHGTINISYYHPARKLNERFCPDYLIVYGENDRGLLLHGSYLAPENITPVGSYYLQYLYGKAANAHILQRMEGYKKSVCVPTSANTHDYLMSFVKTVAPRLPDTIFIVIPREKHLSSVDLPTNVRVENGFSFQEVARHCTFNSCTRSTCCLEALTLGTQNVLIDEDGLARYYFGSLLNNITFTRYCRNADDYINTINTFEIQDRSIVHANNRANFSPDYDTNLNIALNKIFDDNHY